MCLPAPTSILTVEVFILQFFSDGTTYVGQSFVELSNNKLSNNRQQRCIPYLEVSMEKIMGGGLVCPHCLLFRDSTEIPQQQDVQ